MFLFAKYEAKSLIRRLLLIVAMAVLSSPLFGSGAALATSCDVLPAYLQMSYQFQWSKEKQRAYANQFQTGCVSGAYIGRLTNDIERRLRADGIAVQQITILPSDDAQVISVKVTTNKDVAGAAPEMSVLLPLSAASTGKVITSLEIIGQPQEGDELIARYTVNERAYQSGGGKLVIKWLRNGTPIEGAGKGRYQLQRDDVGAQITAQLSYEGGTGALQDSRQADVMAQIMAANYPPSIEDLTIEGVAETGQELVARYRFIDENEGDLEGATRFIWLRDNIAIPEATGPSYVLGASDIDKQISVRVEPQSTDGQTGLARSATMAQKIRPATIVANREVVDNIIIDDANKSFDAKALEESIADALPKIVSIAKPKPRPDVPSKQVPAEDIPLEETDVIAQKPVAKEDAPAIIIDDIVIAPKKEAPIDEPLGDDVAKDAPILLSEPEPAPTVLTPGFELTATSPTTFTDLAFTPSAILLEHELKRVQKAVKGEAITLEAIKTILDEVNALYLEKGFELSRALLPEQTVSDGVVTIQLVEATIGKITLENRKNLDEAFILDHLGAAEGDYISLSALERSIRTYNMSNKSKLATELAPGEAFGQTDIFVDVAEPDKVELPSVSVNNYANQTSDWRQNAIAITMNNLYGIDDETAISFTDSQGSTAVSGSFSMPLDNEGGNISVSLSTSDTKIVAGSEETVGYRGSASSLGVTLSQPVYLGDDYSVYLSGSYGQSKSDLVQPVTGAMLSKSEVRKYSLAMPYSYNNGTTAFSVAPSVHALNVITKIPEREKWMQKVNVDLTAQHFLSDKWTLNGRGQLLYTRARDMINLPSEILSVGGPSSVRAYQPAESSGYQGYFVTGELRTDLANWEQISLPSFMPSAQTYIFLDHMMAQSQYNVRSRADYWSGYGIGLQIPSIFNLLTFDVYWSEPLDGDIHAEEKEFYDDELFQFSLSARFRIE